MGYEGERKNMRELIGIRGIVKVREVVEEKYKRIDEREG